MTDSVQGDIASNKVFLMKLYCATRLVQQMKKNLEEQHGCVEKKQSVESVPSGVGGGTETAVFMTCSSGGSACSSGGGSGGGGNVGVGGGGVGVGGSSAVGNGGTRQADLKYDFSELLRDYESFESEYLDKGELDIFLYDVNILANQHNLANSPLFTDMVNASVKKFNMERREVPPSHSVYDTPIDLVGVQI